MRIALPEAVLSVVGIQPGVGQLGAATAALEATFPVIEQRLETLLLRTRRKDRFDLSATETKNPSLRLEQGFVVDDASIVIVANDVTLTSQDYFLDFTLGVVRLFGTFTQGVQAVSVEYNAGFETAVGDADALAGIPESLNQGGILMAASFLLLNPANAPKDKARFLTQVSLRGLEQRALQCLSAYTRPRATAVWPSFSEIVV